MRIRPLSPACRLVASVLPLALVGAWASSPAESAAEPEIRIKTPRHLSTVVGPTPIELEIELPAGFELDRVEVRVDGALLETLGAPPWIVEWDAGDATRGHQLEAFLFLTDGTQVRASTRTTALRINQVENVGLVNLYALVRDKKGAYVGDLDQGAFRILENGIPQSISVFTTERKPLRVGIVLDTSLSMSTGNGAKLKNARQSALEFLGVLEPGDEGMVVSFNDDVIIEQDLTSNKKLLADAIQRAESKGGTALYDAIWRTARKLEDLTSTAGA